MMLKSRHCFYIPEANARAVNTFLIRHGFGPGNFSRKVRDDKGAVFFICTLLVTDAMAATIKSKFVTINITRSTEASVRFVKNFVSVGRATA